MGLTTALYTGLSGLTTSSQGITVAGNNIANVNTTAYKTSRISFETQILQNLRPASQPTATRGGTNPSQIGLGVKIAGVDRDFNGGSVQPTGVNTDLAIEGNGFFVTLRDGVTRYTRAGNFSLDSNFNLTREGAKLQGYGIDDEFNIIPGQVGDITIPRGALTVAEPTRSVNFSGNLNAGGDAATVGALITSGVLRSGSGAGALAQATDLLTSLFADGGATALFASNDVITITGVSKGGAQLPDHTFEVGAANTTGSDAHGADVQSFLDFLTDILGIDTTAPGSAGVSVNASGQLQFLGNTGAVNDLLIEGGNIINNRGVNPTLPFTFDKQASADGESVRTTFVAYDSLGTPMTFDLAIVLEDKTNVGTNWRFYVQSEDDTDLDRVLGTGLLNFDNNGRIIDSSGNAVTIDRGNTGAFTPQQIVLNFTDPEAGLSALTDTTSQVAALSQDGSPIGTLEDFSISNDGRVIGVFSNSLLRDLGQIVMAVFANNQGLREVGNSVYDVTVNSGTAALVSPGTGGAGLVIGGALELSNVELSQEFINLITASTGFSASSRIVTTSDRLIQELLATLR